MKGSTVDGEGKSRMTWALEARKLYQVQVKLHGGCMGFMPSRGWKGIGDM